MPPSRHATGGCIVGDINRSTIIHPFTLLNYLASLVHAKSNASRGPLSTEIPISDQSKGVGDEDVKTTPLEELLKDIAYILEGKSENHSKTSGFTATEMMDNLTAYVEESAKQCWDAKPYSPWTSFTNSALSLLQDIKNPNFVLLDELDENNVIMQLYDPTRAGDGNNTNPAPVLVEFSTAKEHYKQPDLTWSEFARTYASTKHENNDPTDWDWFDAKLVCELKTSEEGVDEDRKGCEHLKAGIAYGASFEFDLKKLSSLELFDPVLPVFLDLDREYPSVKPPKQKMATRRLRWDPASSRPLGNTYETLGGLKDTTESQIPTKKPRKEGNKVRNRAQEDYWDNAFVKAGAYLVPMLCSSSIMTRAHALVLQGRILYVMIADRSGVIITQGFNIVENIQLYLALLFILQRLTKSQWGLYVPLNTATIEINGRELTRTRRFLHLPWILSGSGSTVQVFERETEDGMKSLVAVKFSWPLANRKGENEYLDAADELLSTQDAQDAVLFGLFTPNLGYRRYNETSTLFIRQALGCDLGVPRHLSVLVTPLYAGTIRDLFGRRFGDVLTYCIAAHYYLWKNDICHGDISDRNLLWRPLNPDEKEEFIARKVKANPDKSKEEVIKEADAFVFGILCDFDMAFSKETASISSPQQAGTTQFASSRLLEFDGPGSPDPFRTRYYLDDVESFMWVLAVDTATIPIQEADTTWWLTGRYLDWRTETLRHDCGTAKAAWISHGTWEQHRPTKRHADTWWMLRWLVDIVVHFRTEEGRGSHPERTGPDDVYDALLKAMRGQEWRKIDNNTAP